MALLYDEHGNLGEPLSSEPYKIRTAAYAIIECGINPSNPFIILTKPTWRRNKPIWDLPGGGLETNESIEDALKRESKEEVGIDLKLIDETYFFRESRAFNFRYYDSTHIGDSYFFRATPKSLEGFGRIDFGEIAEIKFIELSKINPEMIALHQRNAFREYLFLREINEQ